MTIKPPIPWDGHQQRQVDLLYQQEFEPLVRFVIAVRGLALPAAEDVAQEAFIRLMRNPPRDWRKSRAWLRTAAIRLAADFHHSAERFREKTEAWGEQQTDAAHSAESEYLALWDRESVRAALAELSPTEARALSLHSSGHSYREIARELNLDEKPMGVFLLRAMQKLRRHYQARTQAENLQRGGMQG